MGCNVTVMGKSVTAVGSENKQNKRELKKHAATIHCSNTLSLLQRKITNALLYHAYKELSLKEEHEITVKQLCRLIGYQGNNHAAIKDALRGLISTVIEWNVVSDKTGEENWTASSILASVSLQGPLCYYAYSPRMRQLLHSPSMFGKIDLVIQSHFRSSYGLALYENCIRYRGLPNTKWFDVELFKKLMGVPEEKYQIFRDFKRRVLDKAVDEVNTYSDLVIVPEYVKEKRKVAKIRFILTEREKKKRLGTDIEKENLPEMGGLLQTKLLEQFCLSHDQLRLVQQHYESVYIEEKIDLIEQSKIYQQGKVENPAAYLLSALKNDYQAPKQVKKLVHIQQAKDELEISHLKQAVEKIRKNYQAYREQTIHESICSLLSDEYAMFMQRFRHYAEPVISTVLQLQRHAYNQKTIMESPQIKAILRQYALRELDMLNLMSLEEYVANLDDDKREIWQRFKSLDPDHELLKYVD